MPTTRNIPYASKCTQVTVGQYYRVMCAIIEVNTIKVRKNLGYIEKATYLLPIHLPLHTDKRFGVRHKHYHIDGRFRPAGVHCFQVHPQHQSDDKGYNNNGVFYTATNNKKQYVLRGLMPRILKAACPTTGLTISTDSLKPGDKYFDWYQDYIGREVVNGLCPHNKATMLLENGVLRCPLHDLHACPTTNKIIQHPKASL